MEKSEDKIIIFILFPRFYSKNNDNYITDNLIKNNMVIIKKIYKTLNVNEYYNFLKVIYENHGKGKNKYTEKVLNDKFLNSFDNNKSVLYVVKPFNNNIKIFKNNIIRPFISFSKCKYCFHSTENNYENNVIYEYITKK